MHTLETAKCFFSGLLAFSVFFSLPSVDMFDLTDFFSTEREGDNDMIFVLVFQLIQPKAPEQQGLSSKLSVSAPAEWNPELSQTSCCAMEKFQSDFPISPCLVPTFDYKALIQSQEFSLLVLSIQTSLRSHFYQIQEERKFPKP